MRRGVRVIAWQGWSAYRAAMLRAMSRLLAILAVFLMPIGMSGAAAAEAVAAHGATSEHCSDRQKPDDASPSEAPDAQALHCAACSALPAADQPIAAAAIVPIAPGAMALANGFAGIEPEIATPPPRRS